MSFCVRFPLNMIYALQSISDRLHVICCLLVVFVQQPVDLSFVAKQGYELFKISLESFMSYQCLCN